MPNFSAVYSGNSRVRNSSTRVDTGRIAEKVRWFLRCHPEFSRADVGRACCPCVYRLLRGEFQELRLETAERIVRGLRELRERDKQKEATM